jgi:hypothetical protein
MLLEIIGAAEARPAVALANVEGERIEPEA